MSNSYELISSKELKAFRNVNKWRAPLSIFLSWVYLVILLTGIYFYHDLWVLLVISPVLGALQNRLTVLLHDSMHRSLYPVNKVNDFLGKWFCAYPIGNFFHINLIMHANHHQVFGKQSDPNVLTYTVDKHTFIFKDLLKSFFGINILGAFFNFSQKISNKFRFSESQSAIDNAERKLRSDALKKDYLRLIPVQFLLVSTSVYFDVFWMYVYWVLVRVTWCTAFNSIRLFTEHHSDVSDANPILVNTYAGWIERFFIAPLNFHLHGTHHVAPFIPFYQLKELSELIEDRQIPYYIKRNSYLGYLLGNENSSQLEAAVLPPR